MVVEPGVAEARLRLALSAGGIGAWRWSASTGELEWDAATGRLFERGAVAGAGPLHEWADAIHAEDGPRVVEAVLLAVEREAGFDLEYRVVAAEGRERWLRLAGRIERGPDGLEGVVGVVEDVTERIEARRQERIQRERLELVVSVNAALEDADDPLDLLTQVASALVPHLADEVVLVLTGVAADQPEDLVWVRRPDIDRPVEEVSGPLRAAMEEGRATVEADRLTAPLRKQGRLLGAVELHLTSDRPTYDQDDLRLVETLAARVAASVENRRLRRYRDRVARIDAHLADFGTHLAAAPHVEDVLAVIRSDAATVVGADHAEVALVVDAEHLHVADTEGHLVDGVGVVHLDAPILLAEAARRGDIVYASGGDPAGSIPADHGFGAGVASSLYDDERQSIGVVGLSWRGAHRFDEVDASAVRTVSRLCGQSLRRALLVRETQELGQLTAGLATARTSKDVARLLRDHSELAFGTALANVRLVERDSSSLRTIISVDDPDAFTAREERVGLDQSMPAAEVARTGRPIWMPTQASMLERYPNLVEELDRSGYRSLAALPLHTSTGEVVGVGTFAWRAQKRLDAAARSRLTTLCDLAAQTLERTMLADSEHAIVASMQHRLLPTLPDVAGCSVRALYQPATASIGMGGDWYEVITMEDGSVVAVIGDVVGHGVDAVAEMAQIQNLITGLAATGTPVAELLLRTNEMLRASRPIYATAVLLHLDLTSDRLGYQSAGHPWPLLRLADGTVRSLQDRHHAMLGTHLSPAPMSYVDLPPGAAIVAYTDGLVERRHEGIDAGIDRLARHVALDLDRDLVELVDAVRSEGDGGDVTNDDIAVLVIQRDPVDELRTGDAAEG